MWINHYWTGLKCVSFIEESIFKKKISLLISVYLCVCVGGGGVRVRVCVWSGKSNWRGRFSTVDLLVLTSLDQSLFILKILFTFFTKQATLIRRSTVPSLSPQLVFPGVVIKHWPKENLEFVRSIFILDVTIALVVPFLSLTSKKWRHQRRKMFHQWPLL
jgi:hypothetical protein